MSAILHLDDGRPFYCSTAGMSGAYWLMARELTDRPVLRLWLTDLSERCAPFLDIDTRAFESEDREAFWVAARRAYDALGVQSPTRFLEDPNARSAHCLHRLIAEKEKIDRGEPAPPGIYSAKVQMHDVEQRWLSDAELEALLGK